MTLQTLVVIFGVLSALDVVQTYYFPRFGLKEGNPWLAKLMSQEGFDVLFLVKYAVFAGVLIASAQEWIGRTELYVAIGLQTGVVAWNAHKMLRNR